MDWPGLSGLSDRVRTPIKRETNRPASKSRHIGTASMKPVDAWDAISVPTLCLRGEDSDLLLPEVADEMRARGPKAVVVTIPGCGHWPLLNVPEQFALVERFLNGR